ncbi:MAG: hypothetical protein HQ562_05670 [Candidatus Marinimicrobia bacterium]|nr:hypothetical protein [Candidatus Neomarinimicrobiota bacterium]
MKYMLEKAVYAGRAKEGWGMGANFYREIELPFQPYEGLLLLGSGIAVEEIEWAGFGVDDQRWEIRAENDEGFKGLQYPLTENEKKKFNELCERYEKDGWITDNVIYSEDHTSKVFSPTIL